MSWQKLSERVSGVDVAGPVEGIPAYMEQAVNDWVDSVCIQEFRGVRTSGLKRLEMKMKLDPALNWSSPERALRDLKTRIFASDEFGLDALDYLLGNLRDFGASADQARGLAVGLAMILTDSGSAWKVTEGETGVFGLERRVPGPAKEALAALSPSARAHQHLMKSWEHLMGRHPDPSAGYREAVRAVESAGRPVLLPLDHMATLGKMIATLKSTVADTDVPIGSADQVLGMMEMIWKSQLDRHGTDDESHPFTVTKAEADTAFYVALSLVQMLSSGGVTKR